MEYRIEHGTVYLRIDKGEEVMQTIAAVCKRERIGGGSFQGIGACDRAVLSTWVATQHDFIFHPMEGMLEMICIHGNVSLDGEGEPYLHAHAVFSTLTEEGEVVVTAGHVKEARIGYTGEIVLALASSPIRRQFDERAGITVWSLS